MTSPRPPSGFDTAHLVQGARSDTLLGVGFDRDRDHIPRFIVQLHYRESFDPRTWTAIARMDHNELTPSGHDIYQEGLHVDVTLKRGETLHLRVDHGPLPANVGSVIEACVSYLRGEEQILIEVYRGDRSPGAPPWRGDGGQEARRFKHVNVIDDPMHHDTPAADDVLSPEELREALAEAEGSRPETIEREAAELEINPLESATHVDE